MEKIKKGDIVARKSYGCDILFFVDKIITSSNGTAIAILKGITVRIIADSYLDDLLIIDRNLLKADIIGFDSKIENRLLTNKYNYTVSQKNGKILHLDGDRRYAEKSNRYYKKAGINAIVRNIPEYKQPSMVKDLLLKYTPDILIITGHDGMIKSGINFGDLRNYRNSKYFIGSVIEARKIRPSTSDLAIFAGACQSFFEAIMSSGANFASSPARILIDFMDPLILAEKIATTSKDKFITINDVVNNLRDGKKSIDGIGSKGKKSL